MFKTGDKVRIDLAEWNAWRRSNNMHLINPIWIDGPLIIAPTYCGKTNAGRLYYSIKVGDYRRNCPIDLIRPYLMDKTTISHILVRMQ